MSGFGGARQINTNYGKPTFGRTEIRDIAIAIAVLTLAFTIMFRNVNLFSSDTVLNFIGWILTSFAIVVLSFMGHEMGHKFTAQKYGAWSEFRMYPVGLVLCLVTSVLGILFAAPGAVYIRGYIDDEMNGKISAAGPAVNLVVGYLALALSAVMPNGISASIFFLLAYMNSFLALFNMIPFMPFDGAKIMKWNPVIWVVMIAMAGVLLFVTRFL